MKDDQVNQKASWPASGWCGWWWSGPPEDQAIGFTPFLQPRFQWSPEETVTLAFRGGWSYLRHKVLRKPCSDTHVPPTESFNMLLRSWSWLPVLVIGLLAILDIKLSHSSRKQDWFVIPGPLTFPGSVSDYEVISSPMEAIFIEYIFKWIHSCISFPNHSVVIDAESYFHRIFSYNRIREHHHHYWVCSL